MMYYATSIVLTIIVVSVGATMMIVIPMIMKSAWDDLKDVRNLAKNRDAHEAMIRTNQRINKR